MGASFGTGDRRARNLEINLVPMIDLMSCLTAFLLVTAVWQDLGQIDTSPAGRGRRSQLAAADDHDVYSLLVRTDRIFLGDRRTGEVQAFDRADWAPVQVALAALWARSPSPPAAEVEIAGDSLAGAPVVYQDLIDAMAVARATGIRHLGVVDPASLTTSVR